MFKYGLCANAQIVMQLCGQFSYLVSLADVHGLGVGYYFKIIVTLRHFHLYCFLLQHAYRDGRLEEVDLRHLGAEDGNTVIAKDIRLTTYDSIICYFIFIF